MCIKVVITLVLPCPVILCTDYLCSFSRYRIGITIMIFAVLLTLGGMVLIVLMCTGVIKREKRNIAVSKVSFNIEMCKYTCMHTHTCTHIHTDMQNRGIFTVLFT